MFFVYVIQSQKDKGLYYGYTHDLRKRFKKHNLGLVELTKPRIPFKLVYYEAYASKQAAVKREHNLKLQAKALAQLKLRIRSCFEGE